jgi:hypothetical protein
VATDYTDVIAGTLAWCNEIRARKGLEPLDDLPKGARGDRSSCPCGSATGLRVSARSYNHAPGGETFVLPDAVCEFVSVFDSGELPQYDEAA